MATAVEFDSNGGALNILNAWKALNDADVAPNVGRAGSDTATTDFTSGKAAITLGSTASLKQILQDVNGSFEVGTAYFPTIKDGDEGGVSIGGASLWALNNNDDAKAAATWKFIKFLISPESQAYWNAETGYFPVTTAADEEQTFKDNVAQYPQFQTAIDQLHDSSADYAGALLSVFPEARATRFQAAVRRRTSLCIPGGKTDCGNRNREYDQQKRDSGESSRIDGFPDQQLHRGL